VVYLTASDLYNINDSVTGGHTFVRDRAGLEYAVRRPSISLYGEAQFPTVIDKAAALLHSLAYHHLFADGNKRTALVALTRFLTLNGWEPAWSETEQYAFVLEVAQGKHDVDAIAAWLHARVRPDDG
jgi:death-on-curing protein